MIGQNYNTREIALLLKRAGIENFFNEARWLCGHAQKTETDVLKLVSRRKSGEPLQYILGEWEFYGCKIKTGRGVLIPRPETELLVDVCKDFLKSEDAVLIDLCTGTACIPIALCKETFCRAAGIEISKIALGYAKKSVAMNSLSDRIALCEGDIFNEEVIEKMPLADCITANPPYLSKEDISELSAEVRKEPMTALFGGDDGLDYYRKIFSAWRGKLKKGGIFAVEIGLGQTENVVEFMKESGFEPQVAKDLAGIDRVVYAIGS